MCPVERPKLVVNCKGRGRPIRIGRMAIDTIRGQIQCNMARIRTARIIGRVASSAGIWRVVIISVVAIIAIN